MPKPIQINRAELIRLWTDGVTVANIARHFKCSDNTISERLREMKLRRKVGRLKQAPTPPVNRVRKPKAAPQVAEVQTGLQAAIARAKATPTPTRALGQVAARYRIPYAEVMARAGA